MNPANIFLGIMTALGGTVDIGELVFTVQGGAKFAFGLLWVIVIGTGGIIVFAEMSGRIAAVLQKPTFELIRERMSHRAGLFVLLASNAVNLLTCAAEIGGIATVLQLMFGGEFRMMLLAGAGVLLLALYFLKFEWMDRLFGLMGLALLVYAWTAVSMSPDWGAVLRGLVPGAPAAGTPGWLVYAYYAVGLFSSILMPYEIYFYSSGAIEDGWAPKDLPANFFNAVVGFTLGGLLSCALLIVGSQAFFGQGIEPHLLGTSALPPATELGIKGLLLALLGMLFAISGAAAETALAGAYNIAQFYKLPWGKDKPKEDARLFNASWIAIIVAGFVIALTGVNPLDIVETAVIFAVVVLPFTYYPVIRVAGDRKLMGKHANGPLINAVGWIYFVLITLAGLAAVPLMVLTHMGEG